MARRVENPHARPHEASETGNAVAPWRDPGPLLQNMGVAVDLFVTENPKWNHWLQLLCGLGIVAVVLFAIMNVRRQLSGK